MGRLLENVWIYRIDRGAPNRALKRQYRKSQEQRQSKQYYHWRARVLKRDHYKCRECGKSGKQIKLEAHHIEEWFTNPQLRFNLNNGITLCIECHDRTHPWRVYKKIVSRKTVKAKPKIYDSKHYSQEELKALILNG